MPLAMPPEETTVKPPKPDSTVSEATPPALDALEAAGQQRADSPCRRT